MRRSVSVDATAGRGRVSTIVVVFLATLAALGSAVVVSTRERAMAAGTIWYGYRLLLPRFEQPQETLDLAWIGDSTVTSLGEWTTYADTIVQRLTTRGIRAELLACPGLDFFGYYALIDRVLARQPRVVVMIANLRLSAPGGIWSYLDLLGTKPLADLPRLLSLPYDRRGVSAADLVLARALRWQPLVDAMVYTGGMRQIAARSEAWSVLGPTVPGQSPTDILRQVRDETLAQYVAPREREHPGVRMLAATVERVTQAGARALVIVTPVPVDALRGVDRYDPALYGESMTVLRDVTKRNGGMLLDLHDALSPKEFRDLNGHFTKAGNEKMLRLTEPKVVAAIAQAGRP